MSSPPASSSDSVNADSLPIADLAAELARERAARAHAESQLQSQQSALHRRDHQMRNHLNAIASAVEVLVSSDAGSAIVPRALAILADQTRKLTDLLSVSTAPEPGRPASRASDAAAPDPGDRSGS